MLNDRNYIFINKKKGKFWKKKFNEWANKKLKKIFNNENMTLTILRHIYLTYQNRNHNLESDENLNILARQMGHWISTQRKYMWHTRRENISYCKSIIYEIINQKIENNYV